MPPTHAGSGFLQRNVLMTYQKGECGNLKGRPPGSRNKLSEAFLRDMLAAWEQRGAKAIEKFLDERPHEFVKLVATILPGHFNLRVNEFDELTDEQLRLQFDALVAAVSAASPAEPAGAAPADAAPAPLLLPALPQAT
jgi:hypothetical protein